MIDDEPPDLPPPTRREAWEHQRDATLRQLRARIPADCPLIVDVGTRAGFRYGFRVVRFDLVDRAVAIHGRHEVIAAWIEGFLSAWREPVRRDWDDRELAAIYRTLSRADLDAMRAALVLDMRDGLDATRRFCERRIAAIDRVLQEKETHGSRTE